MSRYSEFKNPNVFCFDLQQYNPNAKHLTCTVFVNYKNELWYADVPVWKDYYFKWLKNRWVLKKDVDDIIQEGLTLLATKI